jgi:crotonobetainyl-CoA:carnitine CoA-transferase CaiB-like acyl-CoA transferase
MAAVLFPVFAAQPASHWIDAFSSADLPCGPVNTVSEAMQDPELAGRFVEHGALPGLPLIPFPAHLAEGMRRPDRMPPPPRLGEHSEALLKELGLSAADIEHLTRERVVRLAG